MDKVTFGQSPLVEIKTLIADTVTDSGGDHWANGTIHDWNSESVIMPAEKNEEIL